MKSWIARLCLLLCCITSLPAQIPDWEWAGTFGWYHYDYCYSLSLDGAGNVYATGYCIGQVDFDMGPGSHIIYTANQAIFIAKYTPTGALVWAKVLDSPGNETGASIWCDVNGTGDIFVAGNYNDTLDMDPGPGVHALKVAGLSDVFLARYDTAGNFVWATSWGGPGYDGCINVVTDGNGSGDVYVAGRFQDSVDFNPDPLVTHYRHPQGGSDLFIQKLDPNGNWMWTQTLGGSGEESIHGMVPNPVGNGEIYLTGHFEDTLDLDPGPAVRNAVSQGGYDSFVLKLDRGGNYVWDVHFGGTLFEHAMGVGVDPATGDVLASGYFYQTVDFDPGVGVFPLVSQGGDVYVARFDSYGKFKWARGFGGNIDDYNYSLLADPGGSGAVTVCGAFQNTADFDPGPGTLSVPSQGNEDFYMLQLDVNGQLNWVKTSGFWHIDTGLSLAGNAQGDIYVAGSTFSPGMPFGNTWVTNVQSGGGSPDIFLCKLGGLPTSRDAAPPRPVLELSPNPARDWAQVYSSAPLRSLRLRSLTGQTLLELTPQPGTQAVSLPVYDLAAGVYLLEADTELGRTVVRMRVEEPMR